MEGEEQLELLSGAGVLAFGLTRQAITNAARHADPTRGDVAAARTGEILCVGGTCVLRLRSRHRKLQLPVLGDRERHKVREVWRLGTVTGRTEVPLPGT